jgi:hypothetical protein
LFKLTGLLRELSRRRVLGIAESDLAKLAAVIGVGNCAMLEFEDGVARLCVSKKTSFENDTASQRRAACTRSSWTASAWRRESNAAGQRF